MYSLFEQKTDSKFQLGFPFMVYGVLHFQFMVYGVLHFQFLPKNSRFINHWV